VEIEFNLFLLACLAVGFASLTVADPVAIMDPADAGVRRLATLEDSVARHPEDADAARELAETYLELRRPGLAVAVLSAADPAVREHPLVAHRLAQAYEASGRLRDARATARLALARCARALGTSDAPVGTPTPRHACRARDHVLLGMHVLALNRMLEWGVVDPRTDPRARLAHDLSERRARIATR